jgi:glycosyltransferase involved in cell wall biosynthesis
MRIAYVASGAAGMYCGSCLHDNTLGAALMQAGHDVALIPTYTPIRTDERAVSLDRVFYGAVNVYLRTKLPAFRHVPRWLGRWLDRPALLNWVSRFAGSTNASDLGSLTESVLAGESGPQAAELERLVTWLRDDFRPDVVHLTNSLFLGMARRIKAELGVPVVVALVGEDLFLEQLTEPYLSRVKRGLAERAQDADAFLAPSRYYAELMAGILEVPRERIRVVPLGIQLAAHLEGEPRSHAGRGQTLGFFARLAPEKGLHLAIEAFRRLAREPGREALRLRLAGYLGSRDRPFVDALMAELERDGLRERCELVGEVDLAGKVAFLRSLDVMMMPATYRESKGLTVLEAMANGVPVVVPRHGSLPEMLATAPGGRLVEPGSVEALVTACAELLDDGTLRQRLASEGRRAVLEELGEQVMATRTAAVYRELLAAAAR